MIIWGNWIHTVVMGGLEPSPGLLAVGLWGNGEVGNRTCCQGGWKPPPLGVVSGRLEAFPLGKVIGVVSGRLESASLVVKV